jgi:hypothetical protein
MLHIYGMIRPSSGRIRTPSCQSFRSRSDRTGVPSLGILAEYPTARERKSTVLVKVFPIKLKDGMQDKGEAVVQEFAPKGPGAEDGTLSFRVYRDKAKADYLAASSRA